MGESFFPWQPSTPILVYIYWHFHLKGAFDSFEHEHLPRTKYDIIVDETSNKPGEQAFEVRGSLLPPIQIWTSANQARVLKEIDLRTISWRNPTPCDLRINRRRCPIFGTEHLQAREPICIRYCFPVLDGEVSIVRPIGVSV